MQSIVNWLINMEQLAADFYNDAAQHFQDDPNLCQFLQQLAKEEEQHAKIISTAAEQLTASPDKYILPRVGEKLKKECSKPIRECKKLLDKKKLSRKKLFNCILQAEYSEWNDIFLFVVNCLNKHQLSDKLHILGIQQHKNSVENFLSANGVDTSKIEEFKNLPSVWKEKILVVDDEPLIVKLLTTILSQQGDVHSAVNGADALKKVEQNYYKLIISDQDMPVMDGIHFFKKASQRYATIKDRFLFFTGNPTQEALDFFAENGVRHLQKPATLHEIKKQAYEVIQLL